VTELVTNSDSSAKRKHDLPHSSGLVALMLEVPQGNLLDTAALKDELIGKHPVRPILVEVVTAKGHGRQPREIVVVDQAKGMSEVELQTALEDIAGDRSDLAGGSIGRNLFGRGLSDVMRAHTSPLVQTFDGCQLTTAKGDWTDRYRVTFDWEDKPSESSFEGSHLTPASTGTVVQFVATNPRFHIPDPPNIIGRLANFYMLRLIAADPNVELVLRQFRHKSVSAERIEYDFPVGQVIESCSRTFDPGDGLELLTIDFLLARSDSKLKGLSNERDTRENGLLIVDDLDACYDLTFVDPDYENAPFLKHIFGLVRVRGLRACLDTYLNSPAHPTSPLRVDRDGFNRDHEFTKRLFAFLVEHLRPWYERERKRIEEKDQSKLSQGTRKRIDDALRHMNKYFKNLTEKVGPGAGVDSDEVEVPEEEVSFNPAVTQLRVDQPRRVQLLIKDSVVCDGCELVASADEGLTVEPEQEVIYRKTSPRWKPHPNFFAIPFTLSSSTVGLRGGVTALIECADGQTREAAVEIANVLEEPSIAPPTSMEFRPDVSTGRPNRRNGLLLYLNPAVITPGHYIRFSIVKRRGAVQLFDPAGTPAQEFDLKLQEDLHRVEGQEVLRVRVPWQGTALNQRAMVDAQVKIGAERLHARAHILLDEPDPNEGGFFKDVNYLDLGDDEKRPSMYAAGVITVNRGDKLNALVFGDGVTEEEARKEFDRRLMQDPQAQQRLATLLLEEMSFRALQELYLDNKLTFSHRKEVDVIHAEVDKQKYEVGLDVYRALVK